MPSLPGPNPNRRTVLWGSAALGARAALASRPATAQAVPRLRYATGGGLGPNEIETLVATDWMRENVLKRHGKDYVLDMVFTRGTPEAASLLAAGQVDLASLSIPAFASALAKDAVAGGLSAIADVHQLAEGYSSQTFYVLADSPIRTVADLKGRTVAVNAFGTATDLILRAALSKNGLDPKNDVRAVELSFPSIGSALREKRIDCGVLPVPFSAIEEARGGIRTLFRALDAFPPGVSIFQAARNDYLKAEPKAVRAWLADYVDALHWLYDPAHRAKALEIAAAQTKSTVEVLDLYFLKRNDYFRDPNGCIAVDLFQPQVDALAKDKLIARRIDMKSYIDTSYLPTSCPA